MNKPSETMTINIDNRILAVAAGSTILQAAEQHNIYIPTLCAHKDLTPFGGCRMCIVEVEGMRGFPTACTTPAVEGMMVRTNTTQVQTIRTEILQLILSEHPSSCLICDESLECKKFMGTIRKAGVTTGCRYCPNDGQCELQEVVEKMGIKEVVYPIYYRRLPVEKNDPFYDRDYNLCILCGRCIRICQELRAANTLAFKQRGRHTIVGPAYERTHMEAGCEFCGACVSVCPTGALYEKTGKWDGKAEQEVVTTCAFCGVGCQMRLQIKQGQIIGSLPLDDPLVNNGQLCVKGRFCVVELVNNYQRLKKPFRTIGNTKAEITLDEAIGLAAEKLSACQPDDVGLLVSANSCNEDLYIAQKFARVALGTNQIDTTARLFYGSGFNAYLDLMRMAKPLSDLHRASVIFCFGLDARFGRSVVGVELRKAIKQGAKIITFNPRDHNFTLIADVWLRPRVGKELELLKSLMKLIHKGNGAQPSSGDDLSRAAALLSNAKAPMILIGTEFMRYDENAQILEAIAELARNLGAGVLPLPAQNNLAGSILMGAYPELLPGGRSNADAHQVWNAQAVLNRQPLKLLYLIGEAPLKDRPACEYLIFQNIYPPDLSYAADLVLPSTAFTEADGTFINGEGRIQEVRKAVDPPGEALADWEILCRIARKMGKPGFDFSNVNEIRSEIAKSIGSFESIKRAAIPLNFEGIQFAVAGKSVEKEKTNGKFPFLLTTSATEHLYRGFPLAARVDGLKSLFVEGMLDLSPVDAGVAGISNGDQVVVTSAQFERVWPARIIKEQPQGALHVTLSQDDSIQPNPHPVSMRKKDV